MSKRWSTLTPQKVTLNQFKSIGRLPESALLLIVTYATLPDIRALSLTCKRLAVLVKDDRIWERKLQMMSFRGVGEEPPSAAKRVSVEAKPPPVDDFGEFLDADQAPNSLFTSPSLLQTPVMPASSFGTVGASNALISFDDEQDIAASSRAADGATRQKPSTPKSPTTPKTSTNEPYLQFKKLFSVLIPFYTSLQTHTTSSLVFTKAGLSPMDKAHILRTLSRLLLPPLNPTRSTATLTVFRRNLQSSIDYFEGALLSEFEQADEHKNEDIMKLSTSIAAELNGGSSIAQVFLNKREIFYEASTLYNPLLNLVKIPRPGSSSKSDLVDGIDFSAMDQFMTFVIATLKRDGELCARVFPLRSGVLLEFADRIAQDVISEYVTPLLSAAQSLQHPLFMLATAAAFAQICRLVPAALEVKPHQPAVTHEALNNVIHRMFEIHMDDYLSEEADWIKVALDDICTAWAGKVEHASPTFMSAANPAQVKRNVLTSFGKALLMPVTIVPKTVAYSFNAVTVGAFNAMASMTGGGTTPSTEATIAEVEEETAVVPVELSTPSAGEATSQDDYSKLQLLLSLDVALQLIQADRESLKRVETFADFSGPCGLKVRDTVEEIFIVLLQTLGEKHIKPAFQAAERHMQTYQPAEHSTDESKVAPLVQFFELVHVGDTISQMIEAYYEKEMANFIDRTDFLNVVVREKKKFETALDDSVASGLNTGVHLLMNQADHLLSSLQEPTDYCPDGIDDYQDTPTKACTSVIDCLKRHCDLLKGSTDKQILEVFYCEIGIRLHGLILKHLKRSMISPEGALQVISDVNAYHTFVVSLKQASITPYFSALKIVVNLYLVDSPKDMATLVKDVQRYDGTLRSEDAYELLQRRTDWRLKEKAVDRALYGLTKEDCNIM